MGVVASCERAEDGWVAEIVCRNKVPAGVVATVLSPGVPARHFCLGEELVTNGASYPLHLPFEVAPLDVVCA